MAILLREMYKFSVIPIKLLMEFFIKLEQIFLKFISNHERPRIPTVILRKNNKAGGIILLDFGQYYEVTAIKTVWYWHKNSQMAQ